jgi:acyl carrier protein
MTAHLTQEAIASRIEEIIEEHIGSDEELTPETNLQDDLGVDSLERVELGIKLEKTFGIALSNEKVRTVATLGDFIQLVVLQVKAQQEEANRV